MRFFFLNPKLATTAKLAEFIHYFTETGQNSIILETVSSTNNPEGYHHHNPSFWPIQSKFHSCYSIMFFQDHIIDNMFNKERAILFKLITLHHIEYVNPTNFLFVSDYLVPEISNFEMIHLSVTSTFFFYTPHGLHLFCAVCIENWLTPITIDLATHDVHRLWTQVYSKYTKVAVFDGRNVRFGWDYSEDCNNFYNLWDNCLYFRLFRDLNL